MNFYGHAVVAGWHSRSPALALGAMLPDFASMCRGRVESVEDERVSEGMALHHATDKVFHGLDEFRKLSGATEARLRSLGVGRGGARASAHVAIELLLDGVLVESSVADELYIAAIGEASVLGHAIAWRDVDHDSRWRSLMDRLRTHGVPRGYSDVDTVADRLVTVLSPRPLLALDADEAAIVGDELPDLQRQVGSRAKAIMDSLRAGLE